MDSFLEILDTQKKFEFQVIPNFKDSEFEETKCIYIYIYLPIDQHKKEWKPIKFQYYEKTFLHMSR